MKEINTWSQTHPSSWIKEWHNSNPQPSIHDTLSNFSMEEIIDAIGVEKLELELRKRKLQKINNKIS